MNGRRPLLQLLMLAAAATAAATAAPTSAGAQDTTIRRYVSAHQAQILAELGTLISLPNVAANLQDVRANAEMIKTLMATRGLRPRLVELDSSVPPVVFGELRVPGATRTLVFYAHYDGQPIAGGWVTDPWTPALYSDRIDRAGARVSLDDALREQRLRPDWRLYGRSASDDKAGVIAILAAVDAIRASGRQPTSNILFFFEGEEEAGSPHLARMLDRHRMLFEGADAWIMVDGPIHPTGRKQVVFGVRGDVNVDLTVYGPTRPLHSGHYGNWAPNPAMHLARLLGSMKTASGRVAIRGWYDDVVPLGAEERRAIAEGPRPDSALLRDLGLARSEAGTRSLAEAINEPSLNINGMKSGDVGSAARNIIPTTASAVLDLRLVKGNSVDRQLRRLIAHVRAQGFHVIDHEPTAEERARHFPIATVTVRPGGYGASRTSLSHPLAKPIVSAVQSTTDAPVVRVPSMGGSLPLTAFNDVLRAATFTIPIANPDNNQHAENENLRLGNLWAGIESLAAVMMMPH